MTYTQTINGLTTLLFKKFVEKFGNIVSRNTVKDFLSQVDDLREVNETYVDYLHDYVMDLDLWA